jgi:small nuclear ribonucleoprotein
MGCEQGKEDSLSPAGKKPISVLQKAINKNVTVRLKSDLEYRGKMSNLDPYMNVILSDAEEYNMGTLSANYGRVVIRGNNVLFIRIRDDV